MTRRSCCPRRRSENAAGQKGKVAKPSGRKKTQPLSKLQCEKNQLVLQDASEPLVVLQTPEKEPGSELQRSYELLTVRGSSPRPAPLPHIGWGSPEDVWLKMVCREQNYRHSKSFMQRHPRMEARMRAILLDWLMEVSEAFTLHRQTFYLAQDYFDRFMLTQEDVEKSSLQLIGISCLFIAAKMEEASPPKLSQMAYVTAGTYYQHEILQMELIILKALRWSLCPETAVSWLQLYFQMASISAGSDLLDSQFPQEDYVQMTRLLDLCILNINVLDFQYRVLAASVLCHFVQRETMERVSGLSGDAVQPCISWMAPLVEATARCDTAPLKDFEAVKPEDKHNIQTHGDYLSMLETSQTATAGQFLTPPNSTEKTSLRCSETQ